MNIKELTKGIFKENPVFVIVLGLCPPRSLHPGLQRDRNERGSVFCAPFLKHHHQCAEKLHS